MAMPALKFEVENPVEERIARLETHVEHMQLDISDLKVLCNKLNDKIDDLKELMHRGFAEVNRRFAETDKNSETRFTDMDKGFSQRFTDMDQRFSQRFTDMDQRFSQRFTDMDKRFSQIDMRFSEIDKQFLKLKIARMVDRVWFLLTAGVILGVMAHGFKWL